MGLLLLGSLVPRKLQRTMLLLLLGVVGLGWLGYHTTQFTRLAVFMDMNDGSNEL